MKRLLFLVALLPACATTRVETTATVFRGTGHEAHGTIAVRAARDAVGETLEFQAYKPRIEKRLAGAGYTVVGTDQPEYFALVGYGVDAGKPSVVIAPFYGQTGGGTGYTFGTVAGPGGSSTYSGTTYVAPSYGVVGTTSVPVTLYTRSLAIDIVDAASLAGGTPRKRYEVRARSTGQCQALVEVFDAMLEAMFAGFPGENGRARTVSVPVEVHC